VADVLRYGARIAGALAAAHHAGIVHRDLKPANVMVTEKSGVKLLEPTTAETALTVANAVQTRSGLVIGTFAYMSPEQARGEPVDARSDIYAFGVLLHEMIAGRRPVDAPALPPATPRDLQRIVVRCLKADRDDRFQAMDDVRMALEDVEVAPAMATSTSGSARSPAAIPCG
jgi:serine/threonine protein kinase